METALGERVNGNRPRLADEALRSRGTIGYLLKVFPRLSETFILNEILELRRRGIPVKIYSLQRPVPGAMHPEAAALIDETVYLPRWDRGGTPALARAHAKTFRRAPGRYMKTLFLAWRRMRPSALKRLLHAGALAARLTEDDVVHVHAGFAHTPASVAWFVRRLTGVPFSFTAHAKDLYLSKPESIRRKCRAARFVLTCNETNAAALRSLAGADVARKLHVVYHGVDLRRFDQPPQAPAEGAARILAVGRLVPKKGLEYLLDAFALIIGDREIHLDICGGGPLEKDLKARAASLGIAEKVTFHGSMVQEALLPRYRAAHIVVLPSVPLENGDRDGIPNVLVEAMAMGRAVVATTAGAIPELVEHDHSGLLVPPRDAAALAQAIQAALVSPQLRLRLGGAAATRVRERFDLSRNSGRVASLFEAVRTPRRVLYLTADAGIPVYGTKGASVHVREVCDALTHAGARVTIFTARAERFAGNATRAEVIAVAPEEWAETLCAFIDRASARLGGRGRRLGREIRRFLMNRAFYRQALAFCRAEPPDAIYERYSLSATAGGALARKLRIPHLLEVNAPLCDEEIAYRGLLLRKITRRLERRILCGADRIFVVSAGLRGFARRLGVHPERIHVLPNGVDLARFHPRRDGSAVRAALGWERSFIVAFSGTLKEWHGTEFLVRAFETLHESHPAARLLFIGDGPMRHTLEKKLGRSGLSKEAHFTGELAHDEVAEHLAAADVLVAPYTHSPRFYFSPLKLYEYLAMGKPIVASDIGQIAEVLHPGRNALLVPPGNKEALAKALLRLAKDPALASRLAHEAALTGLDHGWDHHAEVVLNAIGDLRGARWTRPGEKPPRMSRPRRVAYCLKLFPRFSETFVLNEILELERQGVDIEVFSMKRPQQEPLQGGAHRLRAEITYLPEPRLRNLPAFLGAHACVAARHPGRYIRVLLFVAGRRTREAFEKFALAGIVARRAGQGDIGHLHAHFASGPARLAKFTSLLSGIPFTFTAHAKDLYWTGNAVERTHKLKKRVRLARFVVTISEHNRTFIESRGFRVKPGKVRTVYNGIDLQRLERCERRPEDPPLLLGVGRLVPKKGFDDLIRAASVLSTRGRRCRVELAGDGPERERLAALAASLGIEDLVSLPGSVPLERLAGETYPRAAALVIPAVIADDGDRDGIPTVIIESMALGIPVVSTPVSGIPEAVEDGVTGLLSPPHDAVRLADAIERLLDDSALCARLTEAARRRVEERFDIRRTATALRHIFEKSTCEELS